MKEFNEHIDNRQAVEDPQPVVQPAGENQRKKSNYEQILENSLKTFEEDEFNKTFVDIYGPKGKLTGYLQSDEYESIEIEVPEGLTKELVTAIVMGAAMDPELLKNALSSGQADKEMRFRGTQMKIVQEVPTGSIREVSLIPYLIEARKNARKAIELYKQGNTRAVKQMLKNYATYAVTDVAKNTIEPHGSDGLPINQRSAIFANKEIINGKFNIAPDEKATTEISRTRMDNYKKQTDAMIRTMNDKLVLLRNFNTLGKEAKEKLIGEMLIDWYISDRPKLDRNNRQQLVPKNREQVFMNLGITPEHNEWVGLTLEGGPLLLEAEKANEIYQKYSMSDFEAIMARPDGEEYIKNYYKDKVKDLDIYKTLLNAKNEEQLIAGLQELDRYKSKFVDMFKDHPLPNESKAINDKYKADLERELRAVNDQMIDTAFSDHKLDGLLDAYGFKSLDPAGMKKFAKGIDDIYKNVKGNNYRGGSENYTNLQKKLKELRDLSAEYAKGDAVIGEKEARRLDKLSREFDALAVIYQDNKKDINSSYAKDRVDGIKDARLFVRAMIAPIDSAINDMKEQKDKELFGGKLDVFFKYNSLIEMKKIYQGKKYEDPEKLVIPDNMINYTINRTGGLSVTNFALAATGKYTIEDLMDPDKLRAEKAEMFDKVITAMKNQTPENRRWIAETFYNGRKAAYKMLNDTAKNINFLQPEIYKDEKFCKLNRFYALVQDAEQEMELCKYDLLPVIQEHEPNVQSWNDVKSIWSPLAVYRDAMESYRESTVKLATERTGLAEHATNATSSYLIMNEALKELEILKKAHPDDPITAPDLASQQKLLTLGSGVAKDSIKRNYRFMDNDPKFAKNLAQEMVVGGFLKGVSLVPDKNAIDIKVDAVNFPTEEKLKAVAKSGAFLQKTDAAIKRLSEKEYTDKKEFVKDSAYAIFGQMYRLNNGGLPVDVKTGNEISLDQHVKNQIKNPAFLDLLKSNNKEKTLKNPKQIAALAQNPEKLHQLMEESAQQYQNIKNQQAQMQKNHVNDKQSIHHTM